MTFSCRLRIKAVCIFYDNHTLNEYMCTCASKVIIASYWLHYLSFLSVFSCISSSVITVLRSVRSALVDALRKEIPHCSRGRFPIELFQYSLFIIDLLRTTLFELIVWQIDSYWPTRKEESDAKKRLSSSDPTRPNCVPHTECLEGIPIPKNYILPRQTLLFIVTFSLFSACFLSTSVSSQRPRWRVNGFYILSCGIV